MRSIPYFTIPAVLFVLVCGIFLSFFPNKAEAQLALHNAWYSLGGYKWMGFITHWGEWPLFAVVIIFYGVKKSWSNAAEFLTAAVVSSVFVQVLKRIVFAPSPRPMSVIDWSNTQLSTDLDLPLQFAFPSGHTTTAFVFFTLIALIWRRPAIQVFAVFCAIAVAISRVYLMAHWIIDVMAGAVLGMGIAVFVHSIFSRIQKKPLTKGERLNTRVERL